MMRSFIWRSTSLISVSYWVTDKGPQSCTSLISVSHWVTDEGSRAGNTLLSSNKSAQKLCSLIKGGSGRESQICYLIVAQVVDIGSKNASLISVVMEETGCLGVDIILDDGGKWDIQHLLNFISWLADYLMRGDPMILFSLNGLKVMLD